MKKTRSHLASGYKPKKKRNFPFMKVAVGVFVLIASLGAAEYFGLTTFTSQNNETPRQSEGVDSNQDIYKPATEQEKKQVDEEKTKSADQQKPESPPLPDKVVVISSADQVGGKAVIKTELYGVGWKNCELSFQKGSNEFTKTADVLYQSDFSTCMGFSVPVSEFSEAGEWTVKLTAKKSDGTSSTDTRTMRIVK